MGNVPFCGDCTEVCKEQVYEMRGDALQKERATATRLIFQLTDLDGDGLITVDEFVLMGLNQTKAHSERVWTLDEEEEIKDVFVRKYHEEIDSNFQPVSYSKYKQYLSRTVDTMDPGDWRSQSMIYEGLCVEAALGREMMVASHNKGLHLSRAPRLPTILTSEHNKAVNRASNKVPVMT